MANLDRPGPAFLLSSLLLPATACSGGAATAHTAAPARPAAAPTTAPAAAAAQPMAAAKSATSGGEINIGFTPPITGAAAAEGAPQIKAIKLAVKQINEAGGINRKKINMIMDDNQSTKKHAADHQKEYNGSSTPPQPGPTMA